MKLAQLSFSWIIAVSRKIGKQVVPLPRDLQDKIQVERIQEALWLKCEISFLSVLEEKKFWDFLDFKK